MRYFFLTILLYLCVLLSFGQTGPKFKVKNEGGVAIEYSNSGEFIAVSSKKKVILHNAVSGIEIVAFEGFSKTVSSLQFNRDDSKLAAASLDKSIRIWDLKDRTIHQVLNVEGRVNDLQFVGANQLAYITDQSVGLWDLEEDKPLWSVFVNNKPNRALDIQEELELVAIGGGDEDVYLLDLGTGEVINQLKYHGDWVRNLCFHPTDPLLASSSDDGSIALWDLNSMGSFSVVDNLKSRVYGLEFSGDGSTLAYAESGLYFYSLERGYRTHQIESFAASILDISISPNGVDVATVEDFVSNYKIWDISTLNLSSVYRFKDETDNTAPLIYISNPANITNDKVRITRDIIDLRGTVVDESGVRSLKVNGIVVPVKENGSFVINLPLTIGENYISLEVEDINDNIGLRKFIVDRRDADGTEYDYTSARNFLFIVGINDYEHWPALNNAVKDASDIAKVLMADYTFDFENVTLLKNEQATRANIFNSLRGLIEKVTPNDNLVIYFSGHGFFDDLLNEGYWVPVEARVGSTGDYLPNSSVLKIIENIDSQHTFLVADACFSGSLFSSTNRGYVENVEKFKSRWGLASGRLEVVSDGAQGQNSPFAGNFIDFLENNGKSKFAVSELVQFVKVKTAETSDQTPLGNPLKSLGDEGGEFIFYKRGN